MLLCTTLGSSNFERSIRFYDAVMATLGIERAPDWTGEFMGWGSSYDGDSIWICRPFNKDAPSPGNGMMIAFRAASPQHVQAFHAAALEHGGTDEGAPRIRAHYDPSFYAAYVRNPDGNKLAAVFHQFGR